MRSTIRSVGKRDPAISPSLLAAALTITLIVSPYDAAWAQGQTARPSQAASARVEPGAKRFEELNPKDFDRSENITHAWWPLTPGTQWVYEGYNEEDGKKTPHRIVFTVTDLVKVIGGVRSRVIFDVDYSGGKLVEKELTFFAQDRIGNVWHLGQNSEIYENEFVGGRVWTVDNPEGAKAGIMMPADPKLGTPSYSEGYAPPPFHWTDRGRVYQTGQKVRVPAGNYEDVLVIEEFDEEHSGAFQLKYYARGVGNVRVGFRGDKSAGTESMGLVKINKLSAKELDDVRVLAMDLEKRATMYPMPAMERVPLD